MMATRQVPQQQMQNRHSNKRVTMIKHIVGKVRTTSYSLPDDHDPSFTYGIPNKIEVENAGDVVQSWAETQPTKQTSMRSFPETNKKALQNGCLSSKSQREFAVHEPVMQVLKPPSSKKLEQPSERIFGIKSLANDVPMKELLKSAHSDFEEKDYPNLSKRQKKGRLPPSKLTRSSRLLEASNKTVAKDLSKLPKDAFKMKKFLKVESKVKAMLQ